MSGTFSQIYAPQIAGGASQVASQFIGLAIVENILKQLPRRKVQSGDAYADQARNLLRINLELIDPRDQANIRALLETVAVNKEEIEDGTDSLFQRILLSRAYKRRSKKLYTVVKRASDRGINESLLSQMKRAVGGTEFDCRNPFDDPPLPVSSFANSSVDTLDRVELTTYEAEATGDIAVNLTLHNEDTTTEELLAQIPRDTAGREVQTITIMSLGAGCNEDNVDVPMEGETQGDASVPTP